MAFLIIAIALQNIGLGFNVAWYLGYGPPGLAAAWEALAASPADFGVPANPPADPQPRLGVGCDGAEVSETSTSSAEAQPQSGEAEVSETPCCSTQIGMASAVP